MTINEHANTYVHRTLYKILRKNTETEKLKKILLCSDSNVIKFNNKKPSCR